ncbi:CHASE2 domain-containing sensor protein [Caldalkalibacillus uzonensis]|uniref:CHASE2 domain-containing sensor protein n=1 Tax=Caldalkalibacillus uzonensis TaxID=353224 RepID=A0ABU0CPV7_9BACI|nr:DUF2512 family protein [Caldalkalibacillus uzonensis]MDQ0338414.1 CHASE2 domain-containing sensor protein [Caldalkalibacillus uzonensis]
MKHVWALVIKTIMVLAILSIVLNWMNDYRFGPTFALALLIVGLSYLIGDLAILPMTNNIVATLADIGLNTFAMWIIGPFFLGAFVPFTTALLASVIIGVGEWFFHQYMETRVFPNREEEPERA